MRPRTKKRAKADRAANAMLQEFANEFTRCWICPSRHLLHTHEIVSGANRKWGRSHREALIRVCCDCHAEIIHANWHTTGNIAMEYALKRIRDPKWYNRPLLNEQRGRAPESVAAEDVRMATALVAEVISW